MIKPIAHFVAITILIATCATQVFAQKLPYPARQAVQRQEYNVKKVERSISRFDDLEKLKKTATVTSRQVKSWEAELGNAERLIESILRDVKNAPKSHPRVKAIHDSVARSRARIAIIRKGLKTLGNEAATAADASTYGNHAHDLKQVQMIIDNYRINDLTSDPDASIGVIAELPGVIKWFGERWTTYQPFFKQGTGEARTLHTKMKWAGKILNRLVETCKDYKASAPGSIDRHLDQGDQMIARAVAKKLPLMLTNGVVQAQERAQRELRVLEAVNGKDDATVKRLYGRLTKQRGDASQAEVAMEEQILKDARVPAAAYNGSDRAGFEKRIRADWAKAWPQDEILEVRFHRANWKRNKKVVWNSGEKAWEAIDKGYLTCLVIVKTSDELVTLFPAFINRDFISDATTTGVQTKGGRYVIRKVLMSNYK